MSWPVSWESLLFFGALLCSVFWPLWSFGRSFLQQFLHPSLRIRDVEVSQISANPLDWWMKNEGIGCRLIQTPLVDLSSCQTSGRLFCVRFIWYTRNYHKLSIYYIVDLFNRWFLWWYTYIILYLIIWHESCPSKSAAIRSKVTSVTPCQRRNAGLLEMELGLRS